MVVRLLQFLQNIIRLTANGLFRWAAIVGLIAGIIFVGEIVLEYIFLSQRQFNVGIRRIWECRHSAFLSALWVAYLRNRVRSGVLSAVLGRMISALIWLAAILIVFYIFRGTDQQAQVFRAEGDYEDFARSSMTDFNAFIMEDFLGAGFYHLLLGPLWRRFWEQSADY